MIPATRIIAVGITLLAFGIASYEWLRSPAPPPRRIPESLPPVLKKVVKTVTAETPDPAKTVGPPVPILSELEQHKEIDREHLTRLRQGIFEFCKKHGHYPEYLSQLVPDYVSAETLRSPHKKPGTQDRADFDHADPGITAPSYGYEFSNLEFRDGRTFAEIKEVQRAEWGDAIPLLRCFAYDGTVLNMAYGGDVYETALNWEWDAATLDVVDKYGWGPGLEAGEKVRVLVTGADGQPVADAKVWAGGRSYSFDLPNRPYQTDAHGYATIPIGSDVDRTQLTLRAESAGMSSPMTRYALGELPGGAALSMAPSQSIGGLALGSDGQPLAATRIFLKSNSTPAEGGTSRGEDALASVITNADGKWQACVNPADLPNLTALIGVPGGMPVKYTSGQPLDSAAAKAGTAEVRAAP